MRTYRSLSKLETFEERFRYLALHGNVGEATFGYDRWMNQEFYSSSEWKDLRREAIIRDNGCDLGVPGYEIHSRIVIHHIVPLTPKDLYENPYEFALNLDNLITTTHDTHNAIHYGDERQLPRPLVARAPNDTIPWKR